EPAGQAALDQGQGGQPAALVGHGHGLETAGGRKMRQPCGDRLGPSQRRRAVAPLPKIIPGRRGGPKLCDRIQVNDRGHRLSQWRTTKGEEMGSAYGRCSINRPVYLLVFDPHVLATWVNKIDGYSRFVGRSRPLRARLGGEED